MPTDVEAKKEYIKMGALWPFVNEIKAYAYKSLL